MPLIEIESNELSAIDAFPLSFKVEESLSHNALYQLEFETPYPDIDFDSLLGQSVTINIEQPTNHSRHFNAYIIGGEDCGQRGNKYVYSLTLSCWLWFLQQNRNCRIFQNKNVIEIIELIFERYGIAHYRLDITESYPSREYCVQFAESDFNFVNRLLEDEGIGYFIEHHQDGHTLIISDRQQFPDLEFGYSSLLFTPDGEEGRAIREGIQRIQRHRKVRPNEIVLRDFDYLNPRKNLQAKAAEIESTSTTSPLEWYDYAAGYTDNERGETLARIRLQELQAQGLHLVGESNAIGLMPGRRFSLQLHPDNQRNRGFKLLSCHYHFVQDGPDSSSQGRNISCSFIAMNDDIAWRPERVTSPPRMPGLQSATVVGAPESEVHTDKHARIRVHFHWDRYKTSEEDSSCWIRVVQAWAGKGWGVVAMPRVGQEVLVTYVDGDLDRPMVTGIVYNGDNPPPYRLPEQINYSGLVSRSLRFGQQQNASQLTFDDKRNNERVMLHAERDMQQTTERNRVSDVGQDEYEVVKRTKTEQIGNHIAYRDNYINVTGTKVSSIDLSATTTKTSISSTGESTTSTGISTSYTAVSNSVVGISNSTTGVSTSHVGISTSMVGISNSITGVSNSITGISNRLTGADNAATGSSISVTGSSISAVGSSISTTGLSISFTGATYSQVGVDLKTIGLQSKN